MDERIGFGSGTAKNWVRNRQNQLFSANEVFATTTIEKLAAGRSRTIEAQIDQKILKSHLCELPQKDVGKGRSEERCLLPPDLECERIGGGPAWGNPPLRNVPPPLLQAAPPPPPPPPVGQARVHEPERCENYPEWDEPVLTVCNNFEGRQRRLIPGLALVDADGGGGAVGEQSRGIREVRDLTEDHGSRFCAGHVEKRW